MSDGIGLAEKMLGLPGLVVLDVEEGTGEVDVRVEPTKARAYCPYCFTLPSSFVAHRRPGISISCKSSLIHLRKLVALIFWALFSSLG